MERELLEMIEKVCWESDGLFREPGLMAYEARRERMRLTVLDADTRKELFVMHLDNGGHVMRIEKRNHAAKVALACIMAMVFDAYNQE